MGRLVVDNKRVLFQRNGIALIFYSSGKGGKDLVSSYKEETEYEYLQTDEVPGKSAYKQGKIVKESKLGFYYTVPLGSGGYPWWKDDPGRYKKEYVVYRKHTVIQKPSGCYILQYPIKYVNSGTEVEIGKYDNRPWDIIPGYKGIPDNSIKALEKSLSSFWAALMDVKEDGMEEKKNQIMTDLFGNPDGPTITSDKVKILSHGFDPKISFRKRKE